MCRGTCIREQSMESVSRYEGHPPAAHGAPRAARCVTVGGTGLEQRCRRGVHVAVPPDCPLVPHETDGQAAGRQIDPPVTWVWVGIAAPAVSSCRGNLHCPRPAVPRWDAEEEASIIINRVQQTGGTAAVFGSMVQSEVSGGAAPAAEPWCIDMTSAVKGFS
jgi:hypothetical protein